MVMAVVVDVFLLLFYKINLMDILVDDDNDDVDVVFSILAMIVQFYHELDQILYELMELVLVVVVITIKRQYYFWLQLLHSLLNNQRLVHQNRNSYVFYRVLSYLYRMSLQVVHTFVVVVVVLMQRIKFVSYNLAYVPIPILVVNIFPS